MKDAWIKLLRPEEDLIWDKFYSIWDNSNKTPFRPAIKERDSDVIKEPYPFRTYFIGHIYNDSELRKGLDKDLHTRFLNYFQKLIAKDQYLYALDWNHPCYKFFPSKPFNSDEFWPVPVLPDGDDYIFLEPSFKWGIVGDMWEHSICVFGDALLDLINANPPDLFDNEVDHNLDAKKS